MRVFNKNDFRLLRSLMEDAAELYEQKEYRSALSVINDCLRKMEKNQEQTQMKVKALILKSQILVSLDQNPDDLLDQAKDILDRIHGSRDLYIQIETLKNEKVQPHTD